MLLLLAGHCYGSGEAQCSGGGAVTRSSASAFVPAPPAGLVRARGASSFSGVASESEREGLRMAPQEIEVVGASIAEVNGIYTIRSPGILFWASARDCSQAMLCPTAGAGGRKRDAGREGASVYG